MVDAIRWTPLVGRRRLVSVNRRHRRRAIARSPRAASQAFIPLAGVVDVEAERPPGSRRRSPRSRRSWPRSQKQARQPELPRACPGRRRCARKRPRSPNSRPPSTSSAPNSPSSAERSDADIPSITDYDRRGGLPRRSNRPAASNPGSSESAVSWTDGESPPDLPDHPRRRHQRQDHRHAGSPRHPRGARAARRHVRLAPPAPRRGAIPPDRASRSTSRRSRRPYADVAPFVEDVRSAGRGTA